MGGEGLARGAVDVLATLLHEAAHALAHQRGIQDTSRQGRYHNSRFKTLAEELGLRIDHDPRIGWSLTTLPDRTAKRYRTTLAGLERALTAYRAGEHAHRAGPKPAARNLLVCVCGCGRRLRVAAATLALGPIVCGVCDTPFQLRGEDRGSDGDTSAGAHG